MQQLHTIKALLPHLRRHWKDWPAGVPAAIAKWRSFLRSNSYTPQDTKKSIEQRYYYENEDLPPAFGEDRPIIIEKGNPVYYYDHDYLSYPEGKKDAKVDNNAPTQQKQKQKQPKQQQQQQLHQQPLQQVQQTEKEKPPPPPQRDEKREKRLFIVGLYRSMLRLAFISYPGNPESQLYAWNRVRTDFRKHAGVSEEDKISFLLHEANKYVDLMSLSIQSKLKKKSQRTQTTSLLQNLQQTFKLQQRILHHQAPYSFHQPFSTSTSTPPSPPLSPPPPSPSRASPSPLSPPSSTPSLASPPSLPPASTAPSSASRQFDTTNKSLPPPSPQFPPTPQTAVRTQPPSQYSISTTQSIPKPYSPQPSIPQQSSPSTKPAVSHSSQLSTPSPSGPLSLAQLPPFTQPTTSMSSQKQQQGLVVDRNSPATPIATASSPPPQSPPPSPSPPATSPLSSSHTFAGSEVFQYSLKNKVNNVQTSEKRSSPSSSPPSPSPSPQPSPVSSQPTSSRAPSFARPSPPQSPSPPLPSQQSQKNSAPKPTPTQPTPPSTSPDSPPFTPSLPHSASPSPSPAPHSHSPSSTPSTPSTPTHQRPAYTKSSQSPSEARNEFWRNYSELTKKC